MSDSVNSRPYDLSRRAERTQASKRAVVAAAHELFLARGFADTTVDAISTSSRVPIATVYRLFKTKTAILKQVIDTAVVGDDAPVPLGDRSIVKDAQAADDPKAMTAAFAHVARQVFDNTAALRLVLRDRRSTRRRSSRAAELHRTAAPSRPSARRHSARQPKASSLPASRKPRRATSSTRSCRSTRTASCDSNSAGAEHATNSGSPTRSTACWWRASRSEQPTLMLRRLVQPPMTIP